MGLKSSLFSGDAKLEACLVNDAAHVPPGSAGEHVGKIQTAVAAIDAATIVDSELSGGKYGPSTTAAVLAFKTKRNIINRRYESSVDPIVGKMTIAALDREMLALENAPVTCRLTDPCPCDVAVPGRSRHLLFAFAMPAGRTGTGAASDAQVMRGALDDSRRTV